MTPAELDEKMRLMKQKNAAIQARADVRVDDQAPRDGD